MPSSIPLCGNNGRGNFVLVDDDDFEWLSTWKWFLNNMGYAIRNQAWPRKSYMIRMHRQVLGILHDSNMHCDHINGNKLDNRRKNLRICTRSENLGNSKKHENSTSQFKGVSWSNRYGKWEAHINKDKKSFYLGRFLNEQTAAMAYNKAAKKKFGEFARINSIGGYKSAAY
jgi:hypothetical protein